MKKLNIVIITATLVIITLYLSSAGFRNYRNFKKVEVGMTEAEVFGLMGKTEHFIYDDRNHTTIYLYKPPFYYVSDQIKIVAKNDDKRVIKLVEPE
jgi:hypothetical protein